MRPHTSRRLFAAPLFALAVLAGALPSGAPTAQAATELRDRIVGIEPLSHEVYGYLPYWRLDAGTVDRLRYDLVSTIAFFGIGIKSNGAIDRDWVGYREYIGEDAAAVTNAAHDRGVRVVPTFQLFDSTDGYVKMTKFLTNVTAQDRFIAQALDLMAERKADGAGLDFEPVGALNPLGKYYIPFVTRFAAAMKARFPDAQLVNALSAGGSERIIKGLVGVVDRQMVMTYNYRWSGSTITGAIAPLDHAARNVKIHMDRILQWAPADSLLLGVPYYGMDWPVTSKVPNASVQRDKKTYGSVRSVTYASARDFLESRPKVVLQYDALEGSAFYTYRDKAKGTWRQVYFDDERSVADKYDYAIVSGFAGVGIWTLDNDRGYTEMADVLRAKFYAPIRDVAVKGKVRDVTRRSSAVWATVRLAAREIGTVPERGVFRWTLRDAQGKLIRWGETARRTLYPARTSAKVLNVRLGHAASLRAGSYTLRVRFITKASTYRSDVVAFRQRY